VPESAVVNSSPLIVLARAGVFELLQVAADRVVVPVVVVQEVSRRGPSDPVIGCLQSASWLRTVDPVPTHPALQGFRLGAGETAVLTWALTHLGTVAILDDQAARNVANSLGIRVRGTIGIIVDAKQQGLIGQAAPILEAIRQAGLYVSDRLYETALRLAGE
jgi:predicted nucleic acid-binding protein